MANFITLSLSGWNPSDAGIWDAVTQTGTLVNDLALPIQIIDDNITLNGANHELIGTNIGKGISFTYRSGITIKNISVSNFSFGISSENSSMITIESSSFLNNTNTGIYLHNSYLCKLRNNITSLNEINGIFITSSSNSIIMGNNISNNASYGINLDMSANNTITSNTISDNIIYGFNLYSSADNSFYNNQISNNNSYGIYIYNNSVDNRVYNNNFINNQNNAYDEGTNNSFYIPSNNIGGNYWSDATNTYNNNDGFSDSPYIFYNNRDNFPWVTPSAWSEDQLITSINVLSLSGQNFLPYRLGWYNDDVQIAFTTTSTLLENTPQNTWYRINNGDWNKYQGAFSIYDRRNNKY